MNYSCLAVLLLVGLLSGLAQETTTFDLGDMPTFRGVCALPGDLCTSKCQVAGGRDGICNKVQLCICRAL